MRDPFKSGFIPTSLIAHDLVPVRPSDIEDLSFVAMGFYIQGSGGRVRFKAASGEVREFPVACDNFQLDVAATQIFATGTDRNFSAGFNDDPSSPDYDVWIWAKKPYAP